jgi:hypothetical protein
MSPRTRDRTVLVGLLLLCAAVFLTGINWGLPTRAVDPFLFGGQPAWTGAQIATLAPAEDLGRGADVDANPIRASGTPIVVNATDPQRAEIIRRYRLFSHQPDEMITFKSLSTIRGTRGDPRLYQYGGLWIYPVGALLKLASILNLVDLRADQTFYLDHPEAFGRFYIVARLYVVAWALVGAWAVFRLAQRFGNGDLIVSAAATLCYAFLPVVVNMAHEAKPHLPGAVLALLAILAGARYVESGLTRWWVLAAALCGAAAGMVLSMILVLVILPVMTMLRRDPAGQRVTVLLASLLIALDVYFLTNPYVLIHLVGDRSILQSNLQNTAAMYRAPASLAGVWNAVNLITIGTTPLLALSGAAAACLFAIRMRARSPAGMMLALVCVLIMVQFVLLATGKPAEYARFALLLDVGLMLAAVVGLAAVARSAARRTGLLAILFLTTAFHGVSYVWHFARDASSPTTRLVAAQRLREFSERDDTSLIVNADPAPYCLPPVDLFKWKIVLDRSGSSRGGVSIRPIDAIPRESRSTRLEYLNPPRLTPTPMSWASKPFELTVR